MILGIPTDCARIRPSDKPNTIADNLRVLYCANILNGHMSLSSAKRCAGYLGLNLPFWSWDEAIAKFAEKGRVVGK